MNERIRNAPIDATGLKDDRQAAEDTGDLHWLGDTCGKPEHEIEGRVVRWVAGRGKCVMCERERRAWYYRAVLLPAAAARAKPGAKLVSPELTETAQDQLAAEQRERDNADREKSRARARRFLATGKHQDFDFHVRTPAIFKCHEINRALDDDTLRAALRDLPPGDLGGDHIAPRVIGRAAQGVHCWRNMRVLSEKANKGKGNKLTKPVGEYVANLQAIPYSERVDDPTNEMIRFRWASYCRKHGSAAASAPEARDAITANCLINFHGSRSEARALAVAVASGATYRGWQCDPADVAHVDVAALADSFETFSAGAFVFAYIDEPGDAVELLDLANMLRPHTGSTVLIHDFADPELAVWFPYTLDAQGLRLSGLCVDELARISAEIEAAKQGERTL